MILLDISNIFYANIFSFLNSKQKRDFELNQDSLRYMVLNSIRAITSRYKNQYGELIICVDTQISWRHKIFKNYKHGRSKIKQNYNVDWTELFNYFTIIKNELKEYFPYKVIEVEYAEADDIIATIVFNNSNEKIFIVSADEDFGQLHVYKNVIQYDHIHKKMVQIDNPELFLKEHIIEGDRIDGLPNVLSSDNCFVDGIRQNRLTKKKREILLENPIGMASIILEDKDVYKNYQRNQQLIDFSYIPKSIQNNILDTINNYNCNDRSKLFGYFIKYKLKKLTQNIQDF